jgi:hypothetical protein
MEKTAVEWLIDESMKLVVQYMKGTLNEDTLDDVIYELGTKAKEMEKEQIKNAYWASYKEGQYSGDKTADEYYNETYKNTEQ